MSVNEQSSRGESDADATFLDDVSLEHRIRRSLNHSPRPLLTSPQHSPRHQHMQAQSSAARGGFSHHRDPDDDDKTLSHGTAVAISRLKQDLQRALNNLSRMKQQKETASAKARDAQRKNEQLLQQNKILGEMMATNQNVSTQRSHELETSKKMTMEKTSPVGPLTQEDQGELATSGTDESSGQLTRDLRAALKQVETLQAALNANNQRMPAKSERELELAPTNSPAAIPSTMTEIHEAHIGGVQRMIPGSRGRREQSKEDLQQHKFVQTQIPYKESFCQTMAARALVSQDCQTDSRDSIVDRLSRIRDAADRAALVKDHHREIVRLKAQQDSKIKTLSSHHNEMLQKSLNSTKLLLSSKHKEALEGLQMEIDKSMTSMEKRHRGEVGRLREEIKHGATLSEELLSAAIAKICSGKQLITREMETCGQLKQAVKQLEQHAVYEKAVLVDKYADEVEALKRGWEEQRSVMLDTIQAEFNGLFQQRRSPTSSSRPMPTHFESMPAGNEGQGSPQQSGDLESKTLSSYAGIDKELRETEALVRGLLQNHVA